MPFFTVILVQVNPGEAFTIRREDGQFQCITGPAQVPMMSPNGSVPPIYVPPGYVSQIIEENGVRRVLVLPQQPEFHPGGHSPLHHPPPPPHAHLPAFIPHPAMMPPPPHLYTGMAGGDMSSQYISQYHPAHIYSEQGESEPAVYCYVKLLPRYLICTLSQSTPGSHCYVSDIQARGAVASWVAPARPESENVSVEDGRGPPEPLSYEVSISPTGKDGKYTTVYCGEELSATLEDLRPATDYHVRLAMSSCLQGSPSEAVSFTTSCSEPDLPNAPRKASGTKNTLVLQWKAPCDNGSKIQNYILEWDEGKGTGIYEECYYGPQKQYRVTKLSPASRYSFRLAAKNDMGLSEFSEVVDLFTSCSVPLPPFPPELEMTGVTWLCMKWQRPTSSPKEDDINYVLEMEEEGSVCLSGPPNVDGGSVVSCYSIEVSGPQSEESREVHQGPELDCSVGGLMPGKTYSFRLKAANKAGFGPLSERCEVTTAPGAPEQCKAPSTTCKSPSCVVVSWEAPPCNGAPVTEFRLEWGAAEGSMQVCYSGPGLSHEIKWLLPATNYFCRIQAGNLAGLGPFSEAVLCQTPCSVPAAVNEDDGSRTPPLYSPSSCLGLSWEPPCDHGSEITSYLIDLGERQPVAVGPVTKHIIQNLQPDTSYRSAIRIQALNSLGAGPFSHTFKLKTKPLPPQPPRLECTAFSHQTLRLKWGDGPAKAAASDALQYQLQMGDKSGRFLSLYKGPCHTHKVQRLNESTSYTFRIQAFNEAGEGPFSTVYTFTTPRSPPVPVKVPKVERLDDNSCEVTWEALPPMKGDPILYTLQCMMGNSEFKQAYKGSATSFHVQNLQPNSDYRFRVCAIRQCQDAPELSGPYSPTVTLSPQRSDVAVGAGASASGSRAGVESNRSRRSMTDEQCAFLLLMVFAVIAILIAFVIQYFVIK
uniref:Fibronectin type III domain containing 3A n=1 Tax=Gasterosteus aculeatus aculeatus TaxID=481459 RepID=A0AAQ4RRP0_GASAC